MPLLRSHMENKISRNRGVLTPTPIKNKSATLWDKLSESCDELGGGIMRCESDNQLCFKKHCEIRKFRSFGGLEFNGNLNEDQECSFEIIREENGNANTRDEDDMMDLNTDNLPEQQIPRVSNPIIFDQLFGKNDNISLGNIEIMEFFPRTRSLNVN